MRQKVFFTLRIGREGFFCLIYNRIYFQTSFFFSWVVTSGSFQMSINLFSYGQAILGLVYDTCFMDRQRYSFSYASESFLYPSYRWGRICFVLYVIVFIFRQVDFSFSWVVTSGSFQMSMNAFLLSIDNFGARISRKGFCSIRDVLMV